MHTSELNKTASEPFFSRENKPTSRCARTTTFKQRLSPTVNSHSGMRPESRSIPVRFNPETRFDLASHRSSFSFNRVDQEFARMKETLTQHHQKTTEVRFEKELIRFAINEAEALAWDSQFPLLVFPELTREKTDQARAYYRRQQVIWKRSQTRLSDAA